MGSQTQNPIVKEYYLKPGYIFLPEKPTSISTVIGSSVVVCLYDTVLKIGGMSHFLYPAPDSRDKPTSKFGTVAVLTLFKMMQHAGASAFNLQAQIFGGAYHPDYCGTDIGRQNLAVAKKILVKKNIKIVSEDIQGELGRKIVFNTNTCDIAVLKVGRVRESDWYPYAESR